MRVRLRQIFGYGLGLLTIVVATQAHAVAALAVSAPEIDGSSLSTGIAVVAGGVLILRSLRRRA